MTDKFYMEVAYKEALKGLRKDEVPVGAVVVCDNKIIAKAHNLKVKKHCALKHAEMIAIEKASKKIKDFRLESCSIYITLEPCPMCAGAIISSRIKKVVFSVFDKKFGAGGSVVNILNNPDFDFHCEITTGVLEDKCKNLLPDFFKAKRKK